jgi:carbonic anhydrase/acetyltransferase-like protein (isoleucine patch superfamily)
MIFAIGPDKPEIHPSAFVHPTAEISGKVKIGANASIWGGCILRGDINSIEIGPESNVQDGCVFHTAHDAPVVLGKGVTVGHRAVIHGATVKDYSLIGMSVTLLDRSIVEENCFIGAGAVVKEDGIIPKNSLAVGLPARVVRPLKAEEVKLIVDRASHYISLASRYREALAVAKLL